MHRRNGLNFPFSHPDTGTRPGCMSCVALCVLRIPPERQLLAASTVCTYVQSWPSLAETINLARPLTFCRVMPTRAVGCGALVAGLWCGCVWREEFQGCGL